MDGRDIVLKTPKIENGFLEVPEGPGLGVELNEETMKRYLSPGKSPILIGSK
jgi:L-alanine-DL-glutamate epimerase-like enolase superfamily enzyme